MKPNLVDENMWAAQMIVQLDSYTVGLLLLETNSDNAPSCSWPKQLRCGQKEFKGSEATNE